MSLVDFTNLKQCESVESGNSLQYVFIEDTIPTVHAVHTCTYYIYCTYMYIHVLYLHKHSVIHV